MIGINTEIILINEGQTAYCVVATKHSIRVKLHKNKKKGGGRKSMAVMQKKKNSHQESHQCITNVVKSQCTLYE